MKNNNDFSQILESYFEQHLKLERRFSDNTYSTYLNVIKQYLDFLEKQKIKRKDMCINHFNKPMVLKFLEYVEKELNCESSTRNHKLTVINSFLEYAQSINPTYLHIYLESKSIKLKRVVHKKMDYMSKDELKVFMSSIDLKHKTGYKHYIIFSVLYEAALRVSELINIKVNDLYLIDKNPYIKIIGKGNKERLIYINNSLVSMIEEYMNKFKIEDGYLFLNNSKRQYTRFGINKLVDKYVSIAKKECPTLERKAISPHTFRHSKAVHFLENGTALPTIQRFLGHNSIQTTEIYLNITNDIVAKAVETAADLINTNKEKAIWSDNKLLELLESIK